ncbi:ThiF family adenylyltransferase [Collinsella sp. AGMB00827]|uniref:ThiF family adenylyltransferase n=1 Tax=Collinsella ureilytica TaxID=2869515 RepID=A0ABS7MKK8_9ACTN|nr:ThiF family adenylyltransferase [Collinsella urealyticum]MBY4797906.1 ThiF family adenylyltransferase [Collinsella urealyticum]
MKSKQLQSGVQPRQSATPVTHDQPDAKLLPILGISGLLALEQARVLVLGVGGVGSNCAESLARARVGTLAIVDADIVSLTNINRQAIAFMSTVGRPKVEVMQDMIHDINPDCAVIARQTRIEAASVSVLFEELEEAVGGSFDYIIDAIDTVSVKLALAEFAQTHDLTLISSMGGANKLHPECLRIADIHQTVNCRLSRIIRKECRRRKIRHLKVLYSCEKAQVATAPVGTERHERAGMGTVPYMPAIMGQMIAGEVIRTVTGVGSDPDTASKRSAPPAQTQSLGITVESYAPETNSDARGQCQAFGKGAEPVCDQVRPCTSEIELQRRSVEL